MRASGLIEVTVTLVTGKFNVLNSVCGLLWHREKSEDNPQKEPAISDRSSEVLSEFSINSHGSFYDKWR